MILASAVYLAVINWDVVLSCGMSTHIHVNMIATQYLEGQSNANSKKFFDLFQRQPKALQAGSFFPDWGYTCREYEEVGEAAHWPLFYKHAIEYVKVKYSSELSRFLSTGAHPASSKDHDFEVLLSFLFGVVGHGVGDVAWHGLDGRPASFISAFAEQDWNGDWGKAHQVADAGADLVLAHATSLDYLKASWDIPVNDIIAIYKTMGYEKIRWWDLRRCMAIGLAATQINKISGANWFGKLGTSQSPFLVKHYEDYFHGGLYSMASLVKSCWKEVIASIEEKESSEQLCGFQFPLIQSYKSFNTTILAPDLPLKPKEISESSLTPPEIKDSCRKLNTDSDALLLKGEFSHGQFGSAIAVGNFAGDSRKFLAVSAPYSHDPTFDSDSESVHLGQVNIFEGDNLVVKLISPASWVNGGQFGKSLAVLDMNGDGIDDLVVGAPAHSLNRETLYEGRVWIYLGQPNIGLNTFPYGLIPPQSKLFSGFGQIFHTADLNGDGKKDLIIGSPLTTASVLQAGMICSLFSRPFDNSTVSNSNTFGDHATLTVDWCVASPNPQEYEHFGSSIIVLGEATKWVVVGAPGHHSDKARSTGCLYGFNLESGWPSSPVYSLAVGEHEGMRFASSLSLLSTSSILVSAPAEATGNRQANWQAGRVFRVDLSLSNTAGVPNEALVKSIVTGMDSGAGLGSLLLPFNEAGFSGSWITEPLGDWESGRIYALKFNPDSLKLFCFQLSSKKPRMRLGSSIIVSDLNNDGRLDLIIGQSHHSESSSEFKGHMIGQVAIIYDISRYLAISDQLKKVSSTKHPLYFPLSIISFVVIVLISAGSFLRYKSTMNH